VRRKHLIILPTAGLLAFTIVGCSKQSAQSKAGDEINAIVEAEREAIKAPIALPEQRTYTVDQPGTVTIPADFSRRARLLDIRLAQISEFEAAAAAGSPVHQGIAREKIASVYRSESAYLASMAQADFDRVRSAAVDLQPQGSQLSSLHGLITELEGDYKTVIDTLQSGDMGEGIGAVDLQGVNDLSERQVEIRDLLDKATAEADRLNTLAQQLHDSMIEDEGLELELLTQAQSTLGDERYDTIDQAIRVRIRSRIDQAKSEYNALLAEVETQNAALNRADMGRVTKVIADLESAISDAQAQISMAQTQLTATSTEHRALSASLGEDFQGIEDRLDTLVISRFDLALEKLALSVDPSGGADYSNASASAVLERVRIMEQYSADLASYRKTLMSLTAYGEDILGRTTYQAISARVDNLDTRIAAIATDAEGFKGPAQEVFADASNGLQADSEEATQLAYRKDLLLASFRSIAATVE